MATDEILRAELRRIGDEIANLRLDVAALGAEFKPIRDNNIRFAGYVDKLVRGKENDAANKQLIAQAIHRVGDRVGAMELQFSDFERRRDADGRFAAAKAQADQMEAQVVVSKLDKLSKDITGQHALEDIHGAASTPPPGGAGWIYQFRKALGTFAGLRWYTQLLIVILLLLLGGHHKIEEWLSPPVEAEKHGHVVPAP
jgi:hypothetical protein